MKKTSKIFSMLLAVVMVFAMAAVPAFAATQELVVTDTTANGSITINKNVVVDKDAPVPNETFTFTLIPVADTTGMTSEGQAIQSGIAVTTNSATVAFTNASATTPGSDASDTAGITTNGTNQKYATGTGTISFAGVTFATPGIYRYSLQETAGSTSGMTYDQSKFYVDVYVGYEDANAAAAGTMAILGVKTFRYANADGSTITTLGAKTTNQFTNVFATDSLTVRKAVTGNMGDRNKDFAFSLTVKASTLLTAGTELTVVKTAADNTTSSATVTVGTAYSFNLKHGEKLEVKGLPIGTSYTVTESDYSSDSYTTTITTTGTANGNTVNNTIVAGGNTEAFTNNKNITTPTGILLDVWPYALVVLLAIGGAVLMISKKRRNAAR